jgi:hypothetical protein
MARRVRYNNNALKYPKLYDCIIARSKRNEATGCLEWTGGAGRNRYGQCHYAGKHYSSLHRHVYQHVKGELLPGVCLRHQCHNPICVEVEHLITGTQADNMDDMVKAGRSAKGSRHSQAKLIEEQVVIIKRLLMTGMSESKIAAIFGVTRACIGHIHQGSTWAHLGEARR